MKTPLNRPVIVGMGDYVVTKDFDAVLATCAIGSCLAVAAHDSQAGVGGILHFILPNSQLNTHMAQIQPRMFCDTGLKEFLSDLCSKGAHAERLVLKLAGGATVLKELAYQDIGVVNTQTARRILQEKGFKVHSEDTGGNEIRTLSLEMGTGRMMVRQRNEIRDL